MGAGHPEISGHTGGAHGLCRNKQHRIQQGADAADDIPDVFVISKVVDEELAKERLVDLSQYEFIGGLSTGLLDRVSIEPDQASFIDIPWYSNYT